MARAEITAVSAILNLYWSCKETGKTRRQLNWPVYEGSLASVRPSLIAICTRAATKSYSPLYYDTTVR
jgi:hypothetical protein